MNSIYGSKPHFLNFDKRFQVTDEGNVVLDNFIPYLQPGHKIGKVRSVQKLLCKLNISFVWVQNLSVNSGCVVEGFLGFAFYLTAFVTMVMPSFRCHGIASVSMTFRYHNSSLFTWVVHLLPWYCFRYYDSAFFTTRLLVLLL